MNVVKATAEHVADAIAWQMRRGQPATPADMFSSTGYVVPGVAGWWIYLTDSTLAYAEMLVGNPDVPKDVRNEALDAVMAHGIAEARAAGTRLLVSFVDKDYLEARATKHGFRVLGNVSLVAINLSEGSV